VQVLGIVWRVKIEPFSTFKESMYWQGYIKWVQFGTLPEWLQPSEAIDTRSIAQQANNTEPASVRAADSTVARQTQDDQLVNSSRTIASRRPTTPEQLKSGRCTQSSASAMTGEVPRRTKRHRKPSQRLEDQMEETDAEAVTPMSRRHPLAF
jgi:hypothetical protein